LVRGGLALAAGLALLLGGAVQPAAATSYALLSVPLGTHRFGQLRAPDENQLRLHALRQVACEQQTYPAQATRDEVDAALSEPGPRRRQSFGRHALEALHPPVTATVCDRAF